MNQLPGRDDLPPGVLASDLDGPRRSAEPDNDTMHNNYCDGDHCRAETGEVRVLPYGGEGNLILCRASDVAASLRASDWNDEPGCW